MTRTCQRETEKAAPTAEDEAAAGKLVSLRRSRDRVVWLRGPASTRWPGTSNGTSANAEAARGKAMVVGMSREICVELT